MKFKLKKSGTKEYIFTNSTDAIAKAREVASETNKDVTVYCQKANGRTWTRFALVYPVNTLSKGKDTKVASLD